MIGMRILAKSTIIDSSKFTLLLRRSKPMDLLEVELQIIWFDKWSDTYKC
jgi:hypothetical protein